MALETLKDVKEIGGFEIGRYEFGEQEYLDKFIVIFEKENAIGFKLQNGPIKEVGVNGCQVDTMIEAAKMIIGKLNEKFPCIENQNALCRIDEVLFWLWKRKYNREKRGVEGFDLP